MLNSRQATLLMFTFLTAVVSASSASAQRGGNVAAPPPVGNLAPGAMAALSTVELQGVRLHMPIGKAIEALQAQAYDFNLQRNQQMGRGTSIATYTLVKGTVVSNQQNRERFLLHVRMDKPNDPRRRNEFNPDWPIIGLGYILQDRDNRENIRQYSGYDWSGTPQEALTSRARQVICPTLTAEGFACRETGFGFTTDLLQDGSRGGALGSFSAAADGTYKVSLQAEQLR
ncbi:MAG: hypothetical protein NXH81_05465 [Halieaceae bacterium]|uniref:hypothetical protein n=1 Tax=Haliea alexandrii TaxID=2448162 RepID=UPI001304A559|nr:hypothetical protein [Haliea alexandrii]MCR9184826.1 hypothetical protein [Halieaceae bacterium]